MTFSSYQSEIFNNLETEGEKYIAKLLASSAEENLQLEFKTKKEPNKLELHTNDKQNLGKTLSGFSNAEGGVVIWGIATKKNNGIDKADNPRPIADIDNSFEKFRNQCATTLQPENQGTKFLKIRCSNDPSKGYVVIAVPKGQVRPHMSKAPDHCKYFRRTLSGFDPMQHYEVVDMMRAEVEPDIVLAWTVIHQNTMTNNTIFSIRLLQHNVGRVSATRPYTIFENWPTNFRSNSIWQGNLKIDPPEIGQRAVIPSFDHEVLVPGEIREYLRLTFQTKGSYEGPFFWGENYLGTDLIQDIELKALVGAVNGTARNIVFNLTVTELRTKCLALR